MQLGNKVFILFVHHCFKRFATNFIRLQHVSCLKSTYLDKMYFNSIVVILILFSFCQVKSQDNYLFERLNIDDGLSNNSINCILQTHDGFLWIATKDGLNRYDGQEFHIFKHNSADSSSLPENYVMSLLESSSNMLYIGTWGGGLCKFDPIDEKFIPIRASGFKDEFIQCFFEDHKNNVWFGTSEGGLFRLNPDSDEILNFSKDQSQPYNFPSNNITCIEEITPGKLWIATWDFGLIHLNTDNWEYRLYQNNPKHSNTLSDNGIWHITPDTGNSILLCTISGIDRFNTITGEVIHNFEFDDNFKAIGPVSIRQILKDRKGRIWIGTYDYFGLYLINREGTGLIKNYRFINEDDNQQSISIDRIRWIYEDNKANIWIGTENGLNKLPVHQPFRQFRHLPVRPNSLGGRVVSSILQTKDKNLWIGFGGGGFDKIDLQKDQITHYKNDQKSKNSLNNNDVISIYETRDGKLWICTMFGGLNCFDPITGNFSAYTSNPGDPASIRLDWVNQVLETRGSDFLIGTNSGLDIFNRLTGEFTPFSPEVREGQKILPATIS